MNRLKLDHKTIILWLVGCAFFMEMLDGTALNTAVPQIALSLHQNPINLKAALTSYLLALGVFIPVSGWMADKFGTRNVFGTAMITFLVGSIACGFATSLSMLVVSRVIQGIGGAMMTPVGRLVMLRAFPKSELVHVTSRLTMVTLIAPTLGPVIGGAITTYLSWRVIFFINVPLGLLGCYCIFKFIQNEKAALSRKFDLFGFLILGMGLAGLLAALDAVTDPVMPWHMICLTIVLSICLLIAYYIYAGRSNHAVVDTSIFKAKNFTIPVIGMTIFRISTGGVPFILPLMLQIGFNLSPLYSGLLLAPLALGMLIMKSQIKPLLKHFGFKKILIINSLLVGFSLIQLNWIALGLAIWMIVALVLLYGLFLSLQFSAMNVLLYSQIPENQLSNGSSVISANQQISTCFGIAITAIILEHFLHSRDITHLFSVHAFRYTLISMGAIALLSSLVFSKLPNDIAEHVAKGQAPKTV
ncbi:MAG: DHA2 family efflux MFS transporter permease subunit [Gammaproteobacteria bacterium]|nr:DHA2 family efflux MFS transporter permease subunit [Gammaproteobacteria bacterium]